VDTLTPTGRLFGLLPFLFRDSRRTTTISVAFVWKDYFVSWHQCWRTVLCLAKHRIQDWTAICWHQADVSTQLHVVQTCRTVDSTGHSRSHSTCSLKCLMYVFLQVRSYVAWRYSNWKAAGYTSLLVLMVQIVAISTDSTKKRLSIKVWWATDEPEEVVLRRICLLRQAPQPRFSQ
jgi:hypothetical protein